MGGVADAAEEGDGGVTVGIGAAVDVLGVARGPTEKYAVCDGVGHLSDPLEGFVI